MFIFFCEDLGCEADQIGTDGSGGNEEIRGSGEMKVEGDDSCRRLNRAYGDGDDGDISLENQLDSLDITDEYSNLESEVGKRLNQMVPIPVSMVPFLFYTAFTSLLPFHFYLCKEKG